MGMQEDAEYLLDPRNVWQFAETGGHQYRSPNPTTILMGTPRRAPLIFNLGKRHMLCGSKGAVNNSDQVWGKKPAQFGMQAVSELPLGISDAMRLTLNPKPWVRF